MTTNSPTAITPRSLEVFLDLARDAGNWSGLPLFQGTQADKGNLIQLKQAGLISTDETNERINGRMQRNVWVNFTESGRQLAAQHGVEIR